MRAKGKTGEAGLIERYFVRESRRRHDVILGIGDDAAVTRLAPGYDLVTAMDTLVEGIHFPAGTPARSVGHRCLAVNLSDLAAMGAEALWATLSLSMPTASMPWLREFSRGFFALADASRVALIGGDTVRGPLVITVAVQGRVGPGSFVSRSGARPGDGLFVTGHPGDAVAGRLLLGSRRRVPGANQLRRQFLYPTPRLREGLQLKSLATAMIDVSDGLHDDAGKLLCASGCGAALDAGAIPVSAQLLRYAGPERAQELALSGGDDYELLFTVPAKLERRLRTATRRWPCAVTRLGTVTRRQGLRWSRNRRPFVFKDRTFRHFD